MSEKEKALEHLAKLTGITAPWELVDHLATALDKAERFDAANLDEMERALNELPDIRARLEAAERALESIDDILLSLRRESDPGGDAFGQLLVELEDVFADTTFFAREAINAAWYGGSDALRTALRAYYGTEMPSGRKLDLRLLRARGTDAYGRRLVMAGKRGAAYIWRIERCAS